MNPYAQPPQPGYPPQQVMVQQANPYAYPANAPGALKKDTALILCILGFVTGFCGIQRFYLKQTGMGVLYLLTAGCCGIGQIIDTIQIATMSQQDFDRKYNSPLLPQ
jgi:TM2 domain-containing membrane protein YozV